MQTNTVALTFLGMLLTTNALASNTSACDPQVLANVQEVVELKVDGNFNFMIFDFGNEKVGTIIACVDKAEKRNDGLILMSRGDCFFAPNSTGGTKLILCGNKN